MSPASTLRRAVARCASAVPVGVGTPRSRTEGVALSRSEVFDLLSNPRRRFVISYLQDADEPIEVVTLAEAVAAWEYGTTVDELSHQQRKRVYVSLYQTQIPKLVEHGLVDSDDPRGAVEATGRASELSRYLGTGDRKWDRYYLALAVASTAVFLGASALSSVTASAVAGGAVLAFVALALAHRHRLRVADRRAISELVEREA